MSPATTAPTGRPGPRGPLLLVAAALCFAALVIWPALAKPLTCDEVEFAGTALGVCETGRPIFYAGEKPDAYWVPSQLWAKSAVGRPDEQYGLFHTPLYTYVLAASFAALGPTNAAARLPGLVCFALTLLVLRAILRRALDAEQAARAFPVVAVLYLVNPLLIQEGLMLDYYNTVGTLATAVFFHTHLGSRESRARRIVALGLAMAFAVAAVEMVGVMVAFTAVLFAGLRREWREVANVVAAAALGAALFWAVWWTVARATGAPADYFVRFTLIDKVAGGEGLITRIAGRFGWGGALFAVSFGLLHVVLWTSPFYAALALWAGAARVREVVRVRRIADLDVVLLHAAVVIGATHVYRPSVWFLKYAYPAHPLLVLAIGCWLARRGEGEGPEPADPSVPLLAAVAAAGAAAYVALVGDPVFRLHEALGKRLEDPRFAAFSVAAAGVAWALGRVGPPRLRSPLPAALAAALVACNAGLCWQQRAPYTTSISWHNYGEEGVEAAGRHLAAVLGPGQVPICRKDVGYYLRLESGGRTWINTEVISDARSEGELVRNITDPRVGYIVLDRFSAQPGALPVVARYFEVDRQIGSFVVLRRKP